MIQFSGSILNSILPLSFINSSVNPFHNTLTMSLIVFKITFVTIPRGPYILPLSMFLIFFISPNILCYTNSRLRMYPFSTSVFLSFFKISSISCSIDPRVSSVSMKFSKLILTFIFISIRINFNTSTMLQILTPLTFIEISTQIFILPFTMCFSLIPITFILLSISPFPNSKPLLSPHDPFSIITISIHPFVFSFTVCFTMLEYAQKFISIRVSLVA